MKHKIQIKDRYILEAMRSVGYDAYSAIYELLDNSIDAGSSKIEIVYSKEKRFLVVKDNGIGMSNEGLKNAMDFGCDRVYSTNEIGYFGVGMKSACLNLIDFDENESSIVITTNDGKEATRLKWNPRKDVYEFEIDTINKESLQIGTTITILGVRKFSEQVLKKNSAVIFFPTLKSEMVKIYVNDAEVIYNDPLYRESSKTQKNFVSSTVNNTSIMIDCCLIDQSQEKVAWDMNDKGEEGEARWSYSKGGIYVIYGGRYIEYGGTFGIKNNDPWDSRTRIEFAIPKEMTEVFGVKFNKTNSINLKSNDKINDVVRKIKDMFNWAKTTRQKNGEKIATKDEKKEIEDINKELNKAAQKAGFKKPKIEKPEEEKVKKEKPEKPEREEKQTKARINTPRTFEIRTANVGSTNCFWHLGYENNVFIITLNEAHVFYRDIYKNMNDSGRKDIIFFLAAMAYSEYETKTNSIDVNGEYFWEDYWGIVSTKLKHLITV